MEEGLRGAAQSGNIDALYALIQNDADVLRRVEQVEFVDTPLHIAAAEGHTDFALEMMNLKPSFARKLNQRGFSPIHLALQNGHNELVVDLLSVHKDLVRVKGRERYTALHYVATEGNVDLLSRFLDLCPNCILDLTIRKETALHIAAQNNRLEALKTILQMIQRTPEDDQRTKSGSKALDILRLQTSVDIRQSEKVLNRAPSRFRNLPESGLEDYAKRMKPETINALLVVLNLVLTMTYQAILSPPGSVSQGDASGSNKYGQGKSVLNPVAFLLFYVPNWAAFLMAFWITLTLFRVVAKSITSFLYPLYWAMCFCYGTAIANLAPSTFTAIGAMVPGSILLFLVLPKMD
ncbi:hypothetical protein PTKIN_Ptkin16aG0498600 [Pterospermum kingtungense]